MDQSTLLDADIEFDLEEELGNDDKSHAIPLCHEHRGAEFFPAPGTIVEAICGKLLRVKHFLARPPIHKKCTECSHFQGRMFKCNYCGKEVFG